MTQAVAKIIEEMEQLSPSDRAELADCMVETLVRDTAPEIEQAWINEVRRRMSEIESGEVESIPGEQALAQVRRLVASARKSG